MSFIAFLGCDGSGKSAVIQGITEQLEAEGRLVNRGHWRPRLFPASGSAHTSADDPHGKPARGNLASMVKLGWLWANWWGGWLQWLQKNSRDGVVIFDRYHADLLVDPRRYRYGGPLWLAKLASAWMPQPDIVFFLDAAPEVLLSRKQEVSYEALEASRGRYLALADKQPRMRIIDASRPVDLVIADVLQQIELLEKGR